MAREVFKGLRRPIAEKVAVVAPRHGFGGLEAREGFRMQTVGYETFDIEVTVDMARIAADLGQRAARNRSGRSKYMSGAVVVQVIRRAREVK